MRNLIPISSRRWRVPLAPDVDGPDAGVDERVVASCFDGESRVMYVVTNACNLYGLHTPSSAAATASGDSAPACPSGGGETSCCLEMSLLGGRGGGGGGGGGGGVEGWDCLSVLPSLSSRDVSVSPVVTAQHVANVVVHRAERRMIDKLN